MLVSAASVQAAPFLPFFPHHLLLLVSPLLLLPRSLTALSESPGAQALVLFPFLFAFTPLTIYCLQLQTPPQVYGSSLGLSAPLPCCPLSLLHLLLHVQEASQMNLTTSTPIVFPPASSCISADGSLLFHCPGQTPQLFLTHLFLLPAPHPIPQKLLVAPPSKNPKTTPSSHHCPTHCHHSPGVLQPFPAVSVASAGLLSSLFCMHALLCLNSVASAAPRANN